MRGQQRKPTKATTVMDQLRLDIINGTLIPGERLQMETLKDRYGVGFSPLREALSRLTTRGLVQFEEQCGFRIAPLSLEELYDLYNVRAEIDCLALTLAIENGDDQWEADVIASWHQYEKFLTPNNNQTIDLAKWDILQRNFSYNLVKACKSPCLLTIRDMLHDQSDRYRMLCQRTHYKNKKIILDYIDENQRLVTAVLARNTVKALKITRESWESSVKIIAKTLQQQTDNRK